MTKAEKRELFRRKAKTRMTTLADQVKRRRPKPAKRTLYVAFKKTR